VQAGRPGCKRAKINIKHINMKNYLEFLTDLWKITKEDGGFKSFAALISKHKVSKSSSAVLTEELGFVEKNGKLYVWTAKKPTKRSADSLVLMLKQRNDRLQSLKKANNLADDVNQAQDNLMNKLAEHFDIMYNTEMVETELNKLKELDKLEDLVEKHITFESEKQIAEALSGIDNTESLWVETSDVDYMGKDMTLLKKSYDKIRTENDRLVDILEKNAADLDSQMTALRGINGALRDKLTNAETVAVTQTAHVNRLTSQLNDYSERNQYLTEQLIVSNERVSYLEAGFWKRLFKRKKKAKSADENDQIFKSLSEMTEEERIVYARNNK
jgi:hypothetical protein